MTTLTRLSPLATLSGHVCFQAIGRQSEPSRKLVTDHPVAICSRPALSNNRMVRP